MTLQRGTISITGVETRTTWAWTGRKSKYKRGRPRRGSFAKEGARSGRQIMYQFRQIIEETMPGPSGYSGKTSPGRERAFRSPGPVLLGVSLPS